MTFLNDIYNDSDVVSISSVVDVLQFDFPQENMCDNVFGGEISVSDLNDEPLSQANNAIMSTLKYMARTDNLSHSALYKYMDGSDFDRDNNISLLTDRVLTRLLDHYPELDHTLTDWYTGDYFDPENAGCDILIDMINEYLAYIADSVFIR